MSVLIAFISLVVELPFGYPDRLYRAVGHPITWIGKLISFLDAALNRASQTDIARRLWGVVSLAILILVPASAAAAIIAILGHSMIGLLLTAVIASSLLSQRSLATHVQAVADALESGGLEAGRKAVSMIVGRDPDKLDEAGVSRAAIESLAENFSDGIVAPAFWLGAGGLVGGVAYKAVNTADSMIGHRTRRHEAFGWAAARFDDLVNLPASRLTALLIVLSAYLVKDADPQRAWRAVRRDAGKHRSPNAGWPEAAMAGALGLALAGPRAYGGVVVEDALMGEGGKRDATSADIRRALSLYRMADALLIALFAILSVLILM
ncbi:CobD/CbiB family cobalamin biosynthesis protein [Mesorhizobium sp. Root157]|uniref:adenosylcobinamide-phosphate synthase CbiB n=1 Tax=Mesorhizobium sp. Root157 TaxID=1736477 RepID=UPI0006F9AE15|nr:adenosylcobinamide-phosphate synthase CbiB [Mesorhizobium sp. Root157]KQZ81913.1 CobD/CbiB family cobalamin biosynthesis protein [Mesorhizobium sp. Root157]